MTSTPKAKQESLNRRQYETPKLTVFGHVGALSQAGTGPNSEVIMMNMVDMRLMRQRI